MPETIRPRQVRRVKQVIEPGQRITVQTAGGARRTGAVQGADDREVYIRLDGPGPAEWVKVPRHQVLTVFGNQQGTQEGS